MNKHKPWIETSYHGVITENTDVVLLDPPLVALDKDAPVPYAGKDTPHDPGVALSPAARSPRGCWQDEWGFRVISQVLIHQSVAAGRRGAETVQCKKLLRCEVTI